MNIVRPRRSRTARKANIFAHTTLAALLFASVLAGAQTSSTVPLRGFATTFLSATTVELASLDRSVGACTDFHQFACGGWMTGNPMPADQQRWGRFGELQERNFTILRRILEAPGAEGDRRSAGDYYAACMDEGGIEARGLAPLQDELAQITALSNKDALPASLAHLHGIGVNVFFGFYAQTDLRDATREIANIDQGGLGLPDREYYLKTDAASVTLRQKYAAHVERMLTLVGASATDAANGARNVLALETALAEASLDRVRRRDPAAVDHPMSAAEWQALTPRFNWTRYVTAAGAPAVTRVNVAVPAFLQALDGLIASSSMDVIKTYLRWQLVNASSDMLPRAIDEAHFDFFSRTLGGQQQPPPRWRRCVNSTDDNLGEALGKAFVEEAFGATAKADTLAMVAGIKAAMGRDIQEASWMSDATKEQANLKLRAVVDRIGYPETWRDYSALRINRTDALGNLHRASAFERRRTLARIGRPVDRGEWLMTPPTVNAYYSPDRNNINFPAGILQPPFYLSSRDAAVNYGGIGAVIGHELTHGFDDQGRKFDGNGNLRNWWTEADGKAYESRAGCFADQYSQYVVAGDTNLNGRLTLGENTADNGGVRLALLAYLARPDARPGVADADGLTPEQRFFIGFAQIWCENRRPEFERLRAATDPHSSGKYRVNGVVSNLPEFQKAFSCPANAPMVRQNACRVW